MFNFTYLNYCEAEEFIYFYFPPPPAAARKRHFGEKVTSRRKIEKSIYPDPK